MNSILLKLGIVTTFSFTISSFEPCSGMYSSRSLFRALVISTKRSEITTAKRYYSKRRVPPKYNQSTFVNCVYAGGFLFASYPIGKWLYHKGEDNYLWIQEKINEFDDNKDDDKDL